MPVNTEPPEPKWYAVMTRPRQEVKAAINLKRQGYWTFLPFDRVRRRRRKPGSSTYIVEWIERPYFSRYIFVMIRKPTESLYAVNETDGVSTVVRLGLNPLEIPDPVMDELMARADQLGRVGTVDEVARKKFRAGSTVRVKEESPLAGLVAQVALDSGKEVRIWLEVLGARREVSISPRDIEEIAA